MVFHFAANVAIISFCAKIFMLEYVLGLFQKAF